MNYSNPFAAWNNEILETWELTWEAVRFSADAALSWIKAMRAWGGLDGGT